MRDLLDVVLLKRLSLREVDHRVADSDDLEADVRRAQLVHMDDAEFRSSPEPVLAWRIDADTATRFATPLG
jgi:hypothetical protein